MISNNHGKDAENEEKLEMDNYVGEDEEAIGNKISHGDKVYPLLIKHAVRKPQLHLHLTKCTSVADDTEEDFSSSDDEDNDEDDDDVECVTKSNKCSYGSILVDRNPRTSPWFNHSLSTASHSIAVGIDEDNDEDWNLETELSLFQDPSDKEDMEIKCDYTAYSDGTSVTSPPRNDLPFWQKKETLRKSWIVFSRKKKKLKKISKC